MDDGNIDADASSDSSRKKEPSLREFLGGRALSADTEPATGGGRSPAVAGPLPSRSWEEEIVWQLDRIRSLLLWIVWILLVPAFVALAFTLFYIVSPPD